MLDVLECGGRGSTAGGGGGGTKECGTEGSDKAAREGQRDNINISISISIGISFSSRFQSTAGKRTDRGPRQGTEDKDPAAKEGRHFSEGTGSSSTRRSGRTLKHKFAAFSEKKNRVEIRYPTPCTYPYVTERKEYVKEIATLLPKVHILLYLRIGCHQCGGGCWGSTRGQSLTYCLVQPNPLHF